MEVVQHPTIHSHIYVYTVPETFQILKKENAQLYFMHCKCPQTQQETIMKSDTQPRWENLEESFCKLRIGHENLASLLLVLLYQSLQHKPQN